MTTWLLVGAVLLNVWMYFQGKSHGEQKVKEKLSARTLKSVEKQLEVERSVTPGAATFDRLRSKYTPKRFLSEDGKQVPSDGRPKSN